MRSVVLITTVLAASTAAPYSGRFFSGDGVGDAGEWLSALDTARWQFSPSPLRQDISMLYDPTWNGFVEGPTWGAWWTTNSYGTTLASLPFLPEPHRSFVRNANLMWFTWIGDGTRVGLDDPHPAPDGCLCDAATPNGAYYKQGDGNVPIHDWALEETLSAVIMQAEQLLIERDADGAAQIYLPLFNRTLALIESRRDAATNLFFSGDASNLLAPSFGAWLLPNGTRAPSFLTGMSVSYVAALDRVIELETLVAGNSSDSPWAAQAATHAARRAATLAGLPALLAPSQTYFVKSMDPNGTMHGVLGAARHAYIEAVSNHDAVALDVAERIGVAGLDENIMLTMLGDDVPTNPKTGGPGLRPFSLVVTNAGGLDDMEAPDTSWLWEFGTWVNGGEWASCEARMMMAYAKTGRLDFSLDSWRALVGFASIFRMDAPLVEWGSAVYQPDDPINLVYDMFGVAAALIRSLWSPRYSADALSITPRIPRNISSLNSSVPLLWGSQRIFLSAQGNVSGGISCVVFDGAALSSTPDTFRILYASLDVATENHTAIVYFGAGGGGCPPPPSAAPGIPLSSNATVPGAFLHPLSHETATRALRAMVPQDAVLWLDASTLALPDGANVDVWPDASGNGHDAVQSVVAQMPVFRKGAAAGGRPAVVFDGTQTFLSNANMSLPSTSTIAAVFVDHGTTNDCCTGVFFSLVGCNGLGTKQAAFDDDADASVLMIDWSGSPDSGSSNIKGHQTVASVVYNESGAFSFADMCLQSQAGVVGAAGVGYMVGSRNDEDARFVNGTISEVIVFARPLNDTELEALHTYLLSKWPTGKPLSCGGAPPNCTLPASLSASTARLDRFIDAMRAVGRFADGMYELAHALLAIDAVNAWETRCAGLVNGTISPLASPTSEHAADASYVDSAGRIANGLANVLDGYSNSTDPRKQAVYALWSGSA